MKKSILQRIEDALLGHKYYINIVNTRGTDKCEAASFIHYTLRDALDHRNRINATASFAFVETVSFRSRLDYINR